MENLDFIVKKYKTISTEDLIYLSKKPNELRIEIIPHLQSELLNRGEKEEALLLSEYLINSSKSNKELTKEDIKKIIQDKINQGENLENIQIDLKEMGISIIDHIDDIEKLRNKALEYLTILKQDGLNENEIDNKLKNTFNLSEQDSEILRSDLRKKGRQNLIIGYLILAIMLIAIIITVSINLPIMIATGWSIWIIYKGHSQIKQ
jgi:hypothetical protein